MWKDEIIVGKDYALREKRLPGVPFQRVKILEHVRGSKWKAEWVDPNPGLVDYVASSLLVVPWKDAKAYLKEEESEARLRKHNEEQGYKRDSPIDRALSTVFSSTGDHDLHYWHGVLSAKSDVIELLKTRINATDQPSWIAYTDRQGTLHLPFEYAVLLAKKFCAIEPAAVLTEVESTEQEWSQDIQRGDDYLVGLLNEYRAAHAIIRQWTGHDPAIAAREERIRRLERLVYDAIYALEKKGLDDEAKRLRRAIERRG
jgi:hypothetical protein